MGHGARCAVLSALRTPAPPKLTVWRGRAGEAGQAVWRPVWADDATRAEARIPGSRREGGGGSAAGGGARGDAPLRMAAATSASTTVTTRPTTAGSAGAGPDPCRSRARRHSCCGYLCSAGLQSRARQRRRLPTPCWAWRRRRAGPGTPCRDVPCAMGAGPLVPHWLAAGAERCAAGRYETARCLHPGKQRLCRLQCHPCELPSRQALACLLLSLSAHVLIRPIGGHRR